MSHFIELSDRAIASAESLAAHYEAEGDEYRTEKVRMFQKMLTEWKQSPTV